MSEKKFLHWLPVEESKTVRFSELAHMIAKAMHPGDHELWAYASACENLKSDLEQAVRDNVLTVRNASGLGRHTFPYGAALQSAVVIPNLDLEPFLNARGIGLRLMPHGSGPNYWTLENAATALQLQEGWHGGTRAEFQDQLQEAAQRDELVVRDPRTCLPMKSPQARTFWELVTPADVNAWLEKQAAPYRWNVDPSETELEPAPEADGASNDLTPDPERRLTRLRALGGSATYRHNEWKFKGIAALVASEKSEGRKRRDEKTIRADLKEAAQTELEARRAGFGSGLGQR